MNTTKRCPHCEQTLPVDQFSTDRRYRAGLSSWCRACIAASARSNRARTGNAYGKARQRALEQLRATHPAEFRKLLGAHLKALTGKAPDA